MKIRGYEVALPDIFNLATTASTAAGAFAVARASKNELVRDAAFAVGVGAAVGCLAMKTIHAISRHNAVKDAREQDLLHLAKDRVPS